MDHFDRPSQPVPVEPPENPIPPRDSATVIVARDAADGIEVFMLERHLNSDFAGGAYVFPGGTVDERDRDPDLEKVTDGFDAALGVDLGFYVCAGRETFEEAGVLLARGEDGDPVRLGPSGGRRFAESRRALAAGELTPLQFARECKIRLAADLLRPWARWITPEYAPRRYDARFFVARMPEGQDPLHDDVETTASTWISPADAIERGRRGEFSIIFPTRKTLETVAPFHSTHDLLAAAGGRSLEPVLPSIVIAEDGPKVILPNDATLHEP